VELAADGDGGAEDVGGIGIAADGDPAGDGQAEVDLELIGGAEAGVHVVDAERDQEGEGESGEEDEDAEFGAAAADGEFRRHGRGEDTDEAGGFVFQAEVADADFDSVEAFAEAVELFADFEAALVAAVV
jgi:hypothetical protein